MRNTRTSGSGTPSPCGSFIWRTGARGSASPPDSPGEGRIRRLFRKVDKGIKTRSTNGMVRERLVAYDMAFEYAWLRTLQVLDRARRPMGIEELRDQLARGGFRFEGSR